MPITIRPMERGDYAPVVEILREAFAGPLWNAAINVAEFEKGLRKAERRKFKIRFVAEQEGKIVGFIDGRLEKHVLSELPSTVKSAHQLPSQAFHLYRFFTVPGTHKLVAGKLFQAWEHQRETLARNEKRPHYREMLSTIIAKTHPQNTEMTSFFNRIKGGEPRFQQIHKGPNRKGRELAYFMRRV